MSKAETHALVFGASGISGWAVLRQSLTYPSSTTFDRATGLTRRPLKKEESYLPQDSRLSLVSGVDLTGTVESVVEALKSKVASVETVSHVFFCAYIETKDFEYLRKVNTELLQVAVEAVEKVAPNIKAIILQTGGKGYGLAFPDKVPTFKPPLNEDAPRVPEPWASQIFYYNQYDVLQKLSEGKSWAFSEIRPDGIVGFVPGGNAMNQAYGMAIYLTLFRKLHGQDAIVPFPGKLHGYHSKHSETFQDILAKMEIYAALNRDRCANGSVFNCADGEVVTWAKVWPGICSYFGLIGGEPTSDSAAGSLKMEDFVKKYEKNWDELVDSHELKKGSLQATNWAHVYFMMVTFDFARQYDLSRARSVGFEETISTVKGYEITFDRMRTAKIIP